MPLIVVTTSPRVAPGLLSPAAWRALSSGRVCTGSPNHPGLPYLAEAGIAVEVVDADPLTVVRDSRTSTLVWLAAPGGEEEFVRAVGQAALTMDEPPVIEIVPGSYDLPGARLLDLVQVMDRLRRECPWDRKQTHESLVPYLVEEAYEVLDTIDRGDNGALREELGDLLLQVVFHARLAQERSPQDGGFDVDDVATGIVDKLVRRHPHVFSDVQVSGAGEVSDNWEAIKAAERAARGETGSLLSGVPMGQPALSLAAQLLRRAGRAGVPEELADHLPTDLGTRLFELVRQAQVEGRDPEIELRTAARHYRRRVEEWEAGRTSG